MTIHLVTDRRRLCPDAGPEAVLHCLLQQARYAIDAGIDCLQVRERDMEARSLVAVVSMMVALARGTRTRVVVNDRVDVALAAAADGVHLRSDSMAVAAVRRIAPTSFLIGRSVHSREDVEAAAGADYLIAGTVWRTASKSDDGLLLGPEGFAGIVHAATMPVLAIGGVTVDRIGDVARAGGAGAAAIGLFAGDDNPGGCRAVPLDETVRRLRERFDTSRSRS